MDTLSQAGWPFDSATRQSLDGFRAHILHHLGPEVGRIKAWVPEEARGSGGTREGGPEAHLAQTARACLSRGTTAGSGVREERKPPPTLSYCVRNAGRVTARVPSLNTLFSVDGKIKGAFSRKGFETPER